MILVCGDAMQDEYWYGECERLAPEAPVPILRVERVEVRDGGAANVANNVEAMGVPVRRVFGGGQRIRKIRSVGRWQMFRNDFDYPQEPVKELDLEGVQIAIFVDYGKGTLRDVGDLIGQCKEAGVRVLVDPKGWDYRKYRGADVLKPNVNELRAMVGAWDDEKHLASKVRDLRIDADIGAVLLTRASAGMSLYAPGGPYHVPARAEQVVDVSGAGETAMAALAVALATGHNPIQAMALANHAAGIAVGRFGTAVVSKEEVF